ncbi:NYN domain-containing protein [Chlamydiota bacterium]
MNSQEKIRHFIPKSAFIWILNDSLNYDELRLLLERIGISFNEKQLKNAPTEVLAREISDEAYKNSKAFQLSQYYLDKKNKNEMAEIAHKSLEELRNEFDKDSNNLFRSGNVGKYLWALIRDERPLTQDYISLFIKKVLMKVDHFSSIIKKLEKRPFPQKEAYVRKNIPPKYNHASREKLIKTIDELKGELKNARSEITKKENKIVLFQQKNENITNLHKELLTESQKMKHDFYLQEKQVDAQKKALQLVEKDKKNNTELKAALHHLKRENKKIQYEYEKIHIYKEKNEIFFQKINQLDRSLANAYDRIEVLQRNIAEKERTINEMVTRLEKKEQKIKKVSKQSPKEKKISIGIFIDVQNIYYGAREHFDGKLDYHKLLIEILRDRKLYKAIAYIVKSPEINQENFIDALYGMGFEIKYKDLIIRHDGSMKGDWDLGIAIDMLQLSDKLDCVVLVSGDGDFVDLLKLMKLRNIMVEVFSFLHNTAQDLIDIADYHHCIDERFLINK